MEPLKYRCTVRQKMKKCLVLMMSIIFMVVGAIDTYEIDNIPLLQLVNLGTKRQLRKECNDLNCCTCFKTGDRKDDFECSCTNNKWDSKLDFKGYMYLV